MTIKVGDKMPAVTLKRLTADGMSEVNTGDIFRGRKVVMFAVPGAFTPTCSARHLPGFIDNADAIRAKGVDEIVCMAVNDPFVMKAWGEKHGAGEKVTMLPDGNGELTGRLGLEMDGTGYGLGKRSRRFALVVDDGTVTKVAVEEGGGLDVSSAEKILAGL
jgi:peroxiredoxin